nr:peptidylprolyl isomerase [Microlunatus speluncae]
MNPVLRRIVLAVAVLLLAGCGTIPVDDPLSTDTAAPPVDTPAGPATPSGSASASPAPSTPAPSSSAPVGPNPPSSPVPTGSGSAPPSAAPTQPGPRPPGTGVTTVPQGPETCEYTASGQPSKPVQPPKSTGIANAGQPVFSIATNEGEVNLTLDRAKAPCTVNSFESLALQGFFNGTSCPRLVDSGIYVLQCGDPTGSGNGSPGYEFADETDGTESYVSGVVAMANGGPNTNGSQFFLVFNDSTGLDALPQKYTIFGRMDPASVAVVQRIAAEGQDGTNPYGGGKPNNPAAISRVIKVKD